MKDNMLNKWYAVCIILASAWVASQGVRLSPCGSTGYQEVEENIALTLTCDQYSGSASWVFKTVTGITSNIVPAVVTQPTTSDINRQDSGYTLPVSAAVTRVYSSRGLYSCAGQLGSSSQPGTLDLSPTASDTSNTADRSGRCDVNISIPVTSGTYSCNVTVNPGNTHTSCVSFTITRPSPPTISCPSDFILENTPLTCTCNASNIGQPGGRLRWYTGTGSDISTKVVSANYDVTTLEMTRTVTRGDNGSKFRCVNNWTEKVNAARDYTARVAWGPDTVSIDENTPFYTDTTGSKVMNLTCRANGVNPSPALTYNWNVLCDDKQQRTCTFRPRPGPNGDDNTVITCTVTNNKNNNKQQQKSVTLDIKYPPPSAPQISGYVNGHILYQGDNLILTCAVTGGDPQVTSVTLACPGRSKQKTTNGQSSRLEFSPLSSSDHNLTCMCSGQWAMQGYYNLTDSRNLTVYSPPSTPSITRTGGDSLPALEGETVTMTSLLTFSGHPSAEVTWTSETPVVKNSSLSLGKVGKTDDKRNITCQASNAFTENRGPPLTSTYTLHVYYGPYITVKPAEENLCVMTSDGTSCHVTEGERVHLVCDVESNPAPDTCTWRLLSGTGRFSVGSGSNLDFPSANRTDSGVYQVDGRTTKPDVSDGRLPRTTHSNLTVLVTYRTSDTQLTINSQNNITVSEKEAVTLTCQSSGRPTPELKLLQRDVELASHNGGQLSLSVERSQLSHNTAAWCNNTGIITCHASNGVGSAQDISVQLYVNCKPRSTTADPVPPKVNFMSKPVTAAFDLEAFPLPDNFTFQYLGRTQNASNSQSVPASIVLRAECNKTYADFAVRCIVSVDKGEDSTAEGFYTFTAANAFGEEQFVFQVIASAEEITEGVVNAVAIGVGLAAGLIVIIVVVLVCYCCRQRQRQERMITNTIYESSQDVAPQRPANRGPSGSAYEDVMTEPGRNPQIISGPQPGPSASGADNVYSVVNKPKKTSPAPPPAAGDDANVYSGVDKSKKAPALPPPHPEAGPSKAGKAKPAAEPKPEKKGKQAKGKDKGKKKKETEYGNIASSQSRAEDETEGTVYENYGFQGEGNEAAAAAQPAASGGEGSRVPNADGLLYSTVEFTKEQHQKGKDPDPLRDNTDYAGIDFVEMAKAARKMSEK
ncbi:hypothetical protein ACOMHN_023928 [Nucella lapillus]